MKHFKQSVLILAALVAGPAAAGVVFQLETTDHQASPPAVQVIEISAQGRQLAADLDVGTGGKGRVIFKADQGQMLVVDHAAKSYFALDKQQVSAMAGQVNQARKQMDEALKNVPEAQRAAVEQMMKLRTPQQAQGPVTELKKTDQRADKNGYPCVRYDVLKDGRKINELWVTDWKNIQGAAEVSAVFAEMGDFVSDLTQSLSAALGGAAGMGPRYGQELFGQLSKLGGFPVYSREFADDGSLKAESNLRSAQEKQMDASTFAPPTDYKLQQMFGG